MNPVLRKLSSGRLSVGELADLLEKHIGDGSNESHCETACDALRRIRNPETNALARAVQVLQRSNGFRACEVVQQIIAALRAADGREHSPTDSNLP